MEFGVSIAFWILAVITVMAAIGVVSVRSIFHSAMFLVLAFLAIAGLYITLSADFLAAVQILIYAGAVAILLVFAIMLTRESEQGAAANEQKGRALFVAAMVFVSIGWIVIQTTWNYSSAPPMETTVLPLAELLFNKYVLPFEIASVLLTAAMVGSIILARED